MKSRSNEFEKGHPSKKTQQEIDEFIMKKKKVVYESVNSE